jgi:hypothetical protein
MLAPSRIRVMYRSTIKFITVGDIGYRPKRVAFGVLDVQPDRSIIPPGNPFRSVETDEVAARDCPENAPNLGLRIGMQIGRCGLAAGPSVEVEP